MCLNEYVYDRYWVDECYCRTSVRPICKRKDMHVCRVLMYDTKPVKRTAINFKTSFGSIKSQSMLKYFEEMAEELNARWSWLPPEKLNWAKFGRLN